jgi:carbonic anhydrase
VGSVEFAAEQFHTRLVVVMGHSQCSAITATLEALLDPRESRSRNLKSIADRIRPSIEGLLKAGMRPDDDELIERAVRANIMASVDHLRHGSDILEQLIQEKGLMVVGAEYSLATGVVDFFEEGRA